MIQQSDSVLGRRVSHPILIAACIAVLGWSIPGLSNAQDLESLARRVQVLEDKESIRALILAYGMAHDNRDYRKFADLFAREDGEWIGGFGSAKGRVEIFELMDQMIGHDPQANGAGTYHVMTNEQIEVDGDRASSLTKWTYYVPDEGGNPNAIYLGHYDDEFIREDGEWKFLKRETSGLIAAGPPPVDDEE